MRSMAVASFRLDPRDAAEPFPGVPLAERGMTDYLKRGGTQTERPAARANVTPRAGPAERAPTVRLPGRG